jgi:hypothetical protein
MNVYEVMGITAGVLSFLPCPLYIYDMWKGETKPDRVTWWVLSFTTLMIAVTYRAVGAQETIWFPIGYTISFLTIAILSIPYGDGPLKLHTLDRISLAGAVIAGIVWLFLDAPFVALLVAILTEAIGLIPTAVKAYKRPQSEGKAAWMLTTIASFLNLFALESWTFVLALYPVYVFLTNAPITFFLVRPRTKI